MRLFIKKAINTIVLVSFSLIMMICCSFGESFSDSFSTGQHGVVYGEHPSHHSHETSHIGDVPDHSHGSHSEAHHDYTTVFTLPSKISQKRGFSMLVSHVIEFSSSQKNIPESQSMLVSNLPHERYVCSLPIYLQNSILRI
jgi:hypothetical protein